MMIMMIDRIRSREVLRLGLRDHVFAEADRDEGLDDPMQREQVLLHLAPQVDAPGQHPVLLRRVRHRDVVHHARAVVDRDHVDEELHVEQLLRRADVVEVLARLLSVRVQHVLLHFLDHPEDPDQVEDLAHLQQLGLLVERVQRAHDELDREARQQVHPEPKAQVVPRDFLPANDIRLVLVQKRPVEIYQNVQYKNHRREDLEEREHAHQVREKRDLHRQHEGRVEQTERYQRVPDDPEPAVVENEQSVLFFEAVSFLLGDHRGRLVCG